MQVPSAKFNKTSGRFDGARALGDVMTSRFIRGSLASAPPDRAHWMPSGQMVSREEWLLPT